MSKILDRHYQKDDVQSVANQGVLQQEDRKLRRGSARWLVSSRHNLNHSADVAAAVLDVVAEQPSIEVQTKLICNFLFVAKDDGFYFLNKFFFLNIRKNTNQTPEVSYILLRLATRRGFLC